MTTVAGPTRVLWLSKGLGRGGAEQLLVGLARNLDPARVSVHVGYVLAHKDALVDDLRAADARVSCLSGGLAARWSWPLRLRRMLRDGDFDIVHTHSPVVAVAARLLAPRGVLVMHTEHNVWERYRFATRTANRLTYSRNTSVLAVSDGVAQSIRQRRTIAAQPVVEVLTHGIDIEAVRAGADARQEARQRLRLPTSAFVVGTVANMTPKKDQETLLRAMALVIRDEPSAQVVIVGGGPLEPRLRRLAGAVGLDGHIQFAGVRNDVAEILCGFDVFALPSLHEGLALALLEAMAAEVACVATRVGGIPEVVEQGKTGLLVPVGDHEALAAALLQVRRDPTLRARLAGAARERVGAFDIAAASRRLEEHYGRVLRRRVSAGGPSVAVSELDSA